MSSGNAGLLVGYAFSITWSLKYLVKNFSDFQSNLTAVEKIVEYTETKNNGDQVNLTNKCETTD